MDASRRELSAVSRGLDLCESTLCSDVSEMQRWVNKEPEADCWMVMRVMESVVTLKKAMSRSRGVRQDAVLAPQVPS